MWLDPEVYTPPIGHTGGDAIPVIDRISTTMIAIPRWQSLPLMTKAVLRQVRLQRAYLRQARFDGADLSAVDLRDTQGLVRAQLVTARWLMDSRLPNGLSAPE